MNLISTEMVIFLVGVLALILGVILYRLHKKEVQKRLNQHIVSLFKERYPSCANCDCGSLFMRDQITIFKMYQQADVTLFHDMSSFTPYSYTKTISEIQHHGELICKHCDQVIFLFTKKESKELDYHLRDFKESRHTVSKTRDGMACYAFDPPIQVTEVTQIHSPKDILPLMDLDPSFLPLDEQYFALLKS